MKKIEYIDSYDLFSKGNYISSFTNLNDLEDKIKEMYPDYIMNDESWTSHELNSKFFHVIKSSKIIFK